MYKTQEEFNKAFKIVSAHIRIRTGFDKIASQCEMDNLLWNNRKTNWQIPTLKK
jgi:hypothetical protein